MATESSGNSNGFLYFIVGVLVVAVIGIGVVMYNGGFGRASSSPIDRAADAVGHAADKVSDAAKDATGGH
ncbi:MAG: hypothetical protein ABL956_07825 [Hyphomonadaceae bacterium]